jgi:hypothetical protein
MSAVGRKEIVVLRDQNRVACGQKFDALGSKVSDVGELDDPI